MLVCEGDICNVWEMYWFADILSMFSDEDSGIRKRPEAFVVVVFCSLFTVALASGFLNSSVICPSITGGE